jgi:hypothetical protein
MTPEEIMFQFTAIALKELLHNSGEDLMNKDFSQTHIGKAAANVAKAALEQMYNHLGDLNE